VIIAAHDQQNDVKKIYASIQHQELKDIEIIFVDDNSNDNTSSVIKSFMEKDKRIVYLKNDENRRAFYSRNKGILHARGEYILVIDPDDIILNNIYTYV
jgi:glycosyltransferase involved in cell wall biosynthesis